MRKSRKNNTQKDPTGSEIIGYTTGVFDLFHIGHLKLLKRAKKECDRLIVGVSTDSLSQDYKNKTPIIPHKERMEIIQSLDCVDMVVPQKNMDKLSAWEEHKFHVMLVGDDWKGTPKWDKLEEEFKEVNVKIVYFPTTKHISSTKLRKIVEDN